MLLRLLCAACIRRVKASDAGKLLAFNVRCYTRVLIVCWRDKLSNQVVQEKVQKQWKTMDSIKKLPTFWAHLQNRRPETDQECDVGCGRRQQTMWKTEKNYDVADWHGCSLPEAVQLAKKADWRINHWLQWVMTVKNKKEHLASQSKSHFVCFHYLHLPTLYLVYLYQFSTFLMIHDTAMSAVVTSFKNKQRHNTDINHRNKSRETISTIR